MGAVPLRIALLVSVLLVGVEARGGEVLGSSKRGAKVYETTCQACHGVKGDGGGPAGSVLTPRPRDFTDAARMSTLSDAHLIQVITEGGASVGRSPLMPPWSPTLTPRQIADVAAYVRTFAAAAETP